MIKNQAVRVVKTASYAGYIMDIPAQNENNITVRNRMGKKIPLYVGQTIVFLLKTKPILIRILLSLAARSLGVAGQLKIGDRHYSDDGQEEAGVAAREKICSYTEHWLG